MLSAGLSAQAHCAGDARHSMHDGRSSTVSRAPGHRTRAAGGWAQRHTARQPAGACSAGPALCRPAGVCLHALSGIWTQQSRAAQSMQGSVVSKRHGFGASVNEAHMMHAERAGLKDVQCSVCHTGLPRSMLLCEQPCFRENAGQAVLPLRLVCKHAATLQVPKNPKTQHFRRLLLTAQTAHAFCAG